MTNFKLKVRSPQAVKVEKVLTKSGSSAPEEFQTEKKTETSQPALKQSDSVLHESEDCNVCYNKFNQSYFDYFSCE